MVQKIPKRWRQSIQKEDQYNKWNKMVIYLNQQLEW